MSDRWVPVNPVNKGRFPNWVVRRSNENWEAAMTPRTEVIQISEKRKWGRGGWRPGAGRPRKPDARKSVTLTLHPDILAHLDAIAGRDGISRSEAASRLIGVALRLVALEA